MRKTNPAFICLLVFCSVATNAYYQNSITPIHVFSDKGATIVSEPLTIKGGNTYLIESDNEPPNGGSILRVDSQGKVGYLYNISHGYDLDSQFLLYDNDVLYYPFEEYGSLLTYSFATHKGEVVQNVFSQSGSLLSYYVHGGVIYYAITDSLNHDIIIMVCDKGVQKEIYTYSYQGTNDLNVDMVYSPQVDALFFINIFAGAYGAGGIARIDMNGSYVEVISFDGADGEGPDSFTIGDDGILYGTCTKGGGQGGGSLFALDPITGYFQILYSFPLQDPFVQAMAVVYSADHALYGFTDTIPYSTGGGIFRYDLTKGEMGYKSNDCKGTYILSIAAPQGELLFGLLAWYDTYPFGPDALFALNISGSLI